MELEYKQNYRIVCKKNLNNKLIRHLNIKSVTMLKEVTHVGSKITMILEILSDGKWHEMRELQQQAELDDHQVQEVTKFLNEFNFVKIDSTNKKVRISESFQKLLAQTST